ncbi:hypothetical protein F4780DRAFT_633412 [Xylariomycetidae sp. FL0641]|nr:hypothetical protein F4780DRAFT_633412 [Xylariomycetidae sp. FL0641]
MQLTAAPNGSSARVLILTSPRCHGESTVPHHHHSTVGFAGGTKGRCATRLDRQTTPEAGAPFARQVGGQAHQARQAQRQCLVLQIFPRQPRTCLRTAPRPSICRRTHRTTTFNNTCRLDVHLTQTSQAHEAHREPRPSASDSVSARHQPWQDWKSRESRRLIQAWSNRRSAVVYSTWQQKPFYLLCHCTAPSRVVNTDRNEHHSRDHGFQVARPSRRQDSQR